MVHVWYYPFYYSINAVFWSIAIEVQFYLAYPMFLAIRKRLGRIYPAAFFALSFAFYSLESLVFAHSVQWQFVFRNLFIAHWWQWVLGAFLADFYVRGKATAINAAFRVQLAPVVWGTASLAIGFIDPVVGHVHWNLWLSPVLCVLFLGSVVLSPWWPRMSLLQYVGAFSYSLYLIHPVAIALFVGAFGVWKGFPALLTYVGVSLILSWLFFLVIERPFLSQRQVTHAVLQT
jgi:peptidoglycan/LPS O-acetylase OafA/YrhL